MTKSSFWFVLLALSFSLVTTGCISNNNGQANLFPYDVKTLAQKDLDQKLQDLGIEVSPLEELDKASVTDEEMAALTFLYAYSNTSDLLDHTPEFYLENVRASLKARQELPWGKSIPADQYRHFVLPLRVNNEILDDFRVQYYEELRDLVQGMTMEEAVLELNHWSHQHITYEPSDGRTSSPLATLRNALGRCGEQSTFVTAVLRTVGIPARQVYTPRWAHTDNNHAWVEAWVDGTWHYLGASEPAPVLDNAWFDAPVLRAMMLHTRAFGKYSGQEEWLGADPTSTELNVTSNYVPTGQALVKVLTKEGEPAKGVTVTFRIYNYAELYPAVTRTTNRLGEASVELGLGDVMVVAGDAPDNMAIGQLSIKEGGSKMELTLGSYGDMPEEQHFTIVPPVERTPNKEITPVQEEECNLRMAENNAIRTAYTATFPTTEQAAELAKELQLSDGLQKVLIELFPKSRGYHKEIRSFLLDAKEQGKAENAVRILATLREKDLHDVDLRVLQQALARDLTSEEWQDPNIISPRVMLEHLYPCEPELEVALTQILPEDDTQSLSRQERATRIAQYLEGFHLDDTYNPRSIALNPATVLKYRMGDHRSLTVALVRLLRTARIPAYFDATNGVVVFKDEQGRDQILPFLKETKEEVISADCELRLKYEPSGYLKTPKYESNFTVGYVSEGGQLMTYGFEYNLPYNEVSGTKLLYDKNYISAGNRLADGTVLLSMKKIKCGSEAALTFDQDSKKLSVIGELDAEALYFDLNNEVEKSILSTTGRGYYILVLGRPHHEPTDHILRDMQMLVTSDNQLPVPTLVLMQNGATAPAELIGLLPQATWGRDTQGIEGKIIAGCELSARPDMPLVVVADTFNRVIFISQGYTIGIGEKLAAVIEQIK
ncbi:MAG: transglutaminase-like domain-containing protein [Porphyromonas sp.]|nr:transglutaminase-like domain-containing protein [Porphyromonas sp.]